MLANPVGYVLEGMEPIRQHSSHAMKLKIGNHLAMTALTKGFASRDDIDTLIAMVNVVEALYRLGFGRQYEKEIKAGLDALYAVGVRGKDSNKFILKADEMNALNIICELHDAQLDVITVKDLDRAIDLVNKELAAKRVRVISKGEKDGQ